MSAFTKEGKIDNKTLVMKTLVIIPNYNQGKTIKSVITDVEKYLKNILVIDDGSTDKSTEETLKTKATLITHKTNKGKGAALKTGFQFAIKNNYEAVLCIDADKQHNPKEIPHLINASEKADIIIGTRMLNPKTMPIPMLLTNKILSFIISKITKQTITDTQSGFRLIKTTVLKTIELNKNHYEMESEFIIKAIKAGFKVSEIPIETIYHKKKLRKTVIQDIFAFIKYFLSLIIA